MRKLFNEKKQKAKDHNKPHRDQSYCLVVDYAQNMDLPHFGLEQPGETYYYSPLSVYCLGIVDLSGNQWQLYTNLYHKGNDAKGGNNVASLIVKVLKQMELLNEDEKGFELNLVMDNCGGQNKNRMVLRLTLWLVECGYFKTVNMIFLVCGHTKNPSDVTFNLLKGEYHRSNIFCFDDLVTILSSEQVPMLTVEEGDFEDWDSFFDAFYNKFETGTVQKNYIFSVSEDNGATMMSIYEADGEPVVQERNFKKRGTGTAESRVEAMEAYVRKVLASPG